MTDHHTPFSRFFESLTGYAPRFVADEDAIDRKIAALEKQLKNFKRTLRTAQRKRIMKDAPGGSEAQ